MGYIDGRYEYEHTCTRSLEFDAGHVVLGHENKCANFHGHRYKVLVSAAPVYTKSLDKVGRVVDFSVIKEYCGAWLDANYDHKFLIYEKHPILKDKKLVNKLKRVGLKVINYNPTAENMAEHLFTIFEEILRDYVCITEVTVYETPNCFATYRLSL